MMRPYDHGDHRVTWRCAGCCFRMTAETDDQQRLILTAGRTITATYYGRNGLEYTQRVPPT
jgi:hypothetical protein